MSLGEGLLPLDSPYVLAPGSRSSWVSLSCLLNQGRRLFGKSHIASFSFEKPSSPWCVVVALANGSGRSLCGRQGPCEGHSALLCSWVLIGSQCEDCSFFCSQRGSRELSRGTSGFPPGQLQSWDVQRRLSTLFLRFLAHSHLVWKEAPG